MFFRKKKITPTPEAMLPPFDSEQRIDAKSPGEALKPVAIPPPPLLMAPPPRRRGGFLHRLSALLTFIIICGVMAFAGLMYGQNRVLAPGPLENAKVILIPRNVGTAEIADILTREGVIDSKMLFQAAVWFGKSKNLRAGEYQFKQRASINEAIETLTQGKSILHTLSIPEGLTSDQIVARLMESDILTGEISETPREGALLPDTYKFERNDSRQQIVDRMQAAQKQALAQIWARRSSEVSLRSPQELVTLASIVEKETGRADERSRVASVFLNRLKRGMRLQSDPTIVYGLVGGKGTLGRGIRRSEIERATPYNTYVIEGLPPGPIANPGRAAMEAVANPSRTKDLFFVADGTGGHTFSETLDQHNRSVQRWRQIEKAKPSAENQSDTVDRTEPEADGATTDGGAAAPATGTPGRAKGFDASEGTNKDPLKNRTYDLNSPQTLPDNMKAQ